MLRAASIVFSILLAFWQIRQLLKWIAVQTPRMFPRTSNRPSPGTSKVKRRSSQNCLATLILRGRY